MKFGKALRSRFWRGTLEDEVETELDFHVEMRTREYIAAGMDPAVARDAAVRRFGDLGRVNQTCRQIGRQRDQDMRRTEYLSELDAGRDVRVPPAAEGARVLARGAS